MSLGLQYIILFLALITFVITGNYAIHLYYKRNQKFILNELKNREYQIFNNVSLYQFSGIGFRINTADILILKNQIILFLYNTNFKGKIKQAQPTLLLFENPNDNFLNKGILLKIDNIEGTKNGISISVNNKQQILIKNYKLLIKSDNVDFEKIESIIKAKLYIN